LECKPWFTLVISAVDIIVLVAEIVYNNGFESLSVNPWLGPSAQTLIIFGAKDTPLIRQGQFWRFITPMFLHAGVFHLLMNLFAQIIFGIDIEARFGTWRLMVVYILSGIGGNILSSIFLTKTIEVGASGSLLGLISLYGVDYIINWHEYEKPGIRMVAWICVVMFNLVCGLLPGIDNFAHIGGAIVGFVSSMAVLPHPDKEPKWREILVRTLGVLFTISCFVVGFALFYFVDVQAECTWCKYASCIPVYNWCETFN